MGTPTQALLGTLPTSFDGPLAERQAEAVAHLKERGLPGKKTEGWQFTPISRVTDEARETRPAEIAQEADGAEVLPLAGETAVGSIAPNTDFSALNLAMFEGGVLVRTQKGQKARVRLSFGGDVGASYPRVFVQVAEHSELTLLEEFSGKGMTNQVIELELAPGARVEHVRACRGPGYHVGCVAVRQERDSFYASRAFSFGGALTRTDLLVSLEGTGAECTLDGVYMAGTGEHVDHRVQVDHVSPRASSRQRYRGVLDGAGRGVFDGIVYVRKDAQQAVAHQENRNLLLSDSAIVNTKPHLEIEADDVTASHGATVGALDPDQLFYLRARGIPETLAQGLLTHGFVRELIDDVGDDTARETMIEQVCARLPDGGALRNEL